MAFVPTLFLSMQWAQNCSFSIKLNEILPEKFKAVFWASWRSQPQSGVNLSPLEAWWMDVGLVEVIASSVSPVNSTFNTYLCFWPPKKFHIGLPSVTCSLQLKSEEASLLSNECAPQSGAHRRRCYTSAILFKQAFLAALHFICFSIQNIIYCW